VRCINSVYNMQQRDQLAPDAMGVQALAVYQTKRARTHSQLWNEQGTAELLDPTGLDRVRVEGV